MCFPTYNDLTRLADEVRLEITGGQTTWEAPSGTRHNRVMDDIRHTMTRLNPPDAPCGCFYIADTAITFAPNILRRPDIAIFCTPSPRPDGALTGIIPGAVIEVLSIGYERKDRDAVAHDLSCGVCDVLLVEPQQQQVAWYSVDHPSRQQDLPAPCRLQMGCVVQMTGPRPSPSAQRMVAECSSTGIRNADENVLRLSGSHRRRERWHAGADCTRADGERTHSNDVSNDDDVPWLSLQERLALREERMHSLQKEHAVRVSFLLLLGMWRRIECNDHWSLQRLFAPLRERTLIAGSEAFSVGRCRIANHEYHPDKDEIIFLLIIDTANSLFMSCSNSDTYTTNNGVAHEQRNTREGPFRFTWSDP